MWQQPFCWHNVLPNLSRYWYLNTSLKYKSHLTWWGLCFSSEKKLRYRTLVKVPWVRGGTTLGCRIDWVPMMVIWGFHIGDLPLSFLKLTIIKFYKLPPFIKKFPISFLTYKNFLYIIPQKKDPFQILGITICLLILGFTPGHCSRGNRNQADRLKTWQRREE